MGKLRLMLRKHRRIFSMLGTALAAALILWTVNNPAIVGVSATERQLPVYCVQRDDNKIAISFDAAWGNEDTQKLIDILSAFGVRTTFFVVGDWAEKYPESVKALHEAGHEVMSHSAHHAHFSMMSASEIAADLREANRLIAVCTGDAKINREISDNLMLFLKRRRAENICVVRCGENAARYQERVGSPILSENIYTRAFLSAEDADRRAILLNAVYDHSERSDWEKWVACDSFSKMSSRASADFVPAFLRAAGVTREELLSGDWQPERELLRNLGETEHLRWNAFHYAMGYSTMSAEEFEANARTWVRCKAEGRPCPKIAKNSEKRTHACLVSWEELNELSRRENALTGRDVDYQQMDIDNVLTLPKLLRAGEKKGAGK